MSIHQRVPIKKQATLFYFFYGLKEGLNRLMKGTRPLNNEEIGRVSAAFTGGTFEVRNRSLFMLGVSTGGRISELLSLRVGDVYQNQKPVSDLLFDKSVVKGKETSRAVPVNIDGRYAIDDLVNWHRERYGEVDGKRPLFPSRNKKGSVAMNRQTAHDMLKAAFLNAGLNGKLATHSLRKSFAQRVYEQSGDIYLVQELLGHRSVATTQKYLGVNYADARAAVEGMALASEPYRNIQLSGSFQCLGGELKETADETLFLELALRGYDLSKPLREDDETPIETAEIVKIG